MGSTELSGKLDHRPSRIWHRRGSSFTQMADCSVEATSATPLAEDILKKRDGSVLAKHTILKADLFHHGSLDEMNFRLLGAPNFRKTNLSIYGVAQPSLTGLYTVLTLLGCSAKNPEGKSCTWFNTREEPLVFLNNEPFVLRDVATPSVNIKAYAGISRERLEMMEDRFKADVLKEATENGGLVLIHDEMPDGKVVPCFVGCESVKTSKEVFSELTHLGYRVNYHRVPMSHGLSPMDPFIDDYIEVFRQVPVEHSVVFSCGLGIGRTTFGMLVGLLIRRALMIESCPSQDPFTCPNDSRNDTLRLVWVLEKALGGKGEESQSAIQWVLKRDQIIDNLLAALKGNYKCINDLVRVLENGSQNKRIVDYAIDRCEDMLNLRESILIGRVRHSIQVQDSLETALAFLERYFALIAIAGYLSETCPKPVCFTTWIREHHEIFNMFENLRKSSSKLKLFLPIVRLTGLAKPKNLNLTKEEAEAAHAESTVISNRSGSVLGPHTILKMDLWELEFKLPVAIPGCVNFRKMDGSSLIYAIAQPHLDSIGEAVKRIYEEGLAPEAHVLWINVREEPLVYVHNEPYVLRDRFASLRNLRSYSGIPTGRLELMESRLRDDILAESSMYNEQVLVHAEDMDGEVYPVWEKINDATEVQTMSMVFLKLRKLYPNLEYYRIPVTAEDAPEPCDFDSIFQIISQHNRDNVALIFNCQIGAGRSTTGQVIAAQVMSWLKRESVTCPSTREKATTDVVHFNAVHSILRVIKYGLESKHVLDHIIDDSAAVVNLRGVIEEWKARSEHASDPVEARKAQRKGLLALKRYCLLLLFQAYLNDNAPPEGSNIFEHIKGMESFDGYIERHPEFVKILKELSGGHATLETLQADKEVKADVEGHALTNEVAFVIGSRQGAVLSPLTILKYDHFPGCQKMSLPERIEGAPNFREVSMPEVGSEHMSIYGMAMPMSQAIPDVLERMHAGKGGTRHVLWISLREEPVVFVKGRPFVLRIVKDPVSNLEMTGIVSERVESMEVRMKNDILKELLRFSDKILLHEEELTPHGYDLIPVWEHAGPKDIETPSEVYAVQSNTGYNLSYARIPITDEQAPIPSVFDILFKLIWDKPADTDLMFNCQMGRGRTTTGMIISGIIYLVRNSIPVQLGRTNEGEKAQYLAGNYKLILHLVTVLEYGKESKRYADYAIDLCSHIQNLREAVFNFKLRLGEAPGNEDLREVGMNYLIRYFYLIVFAEFVQQRVKEPLGQGPAGDHEFSQWLAQRREITNLVAKPRSLEFS